MNIIDCFLHKYAKEYDYYYQSAQYTASICETLLFRNGIRAIVTYRAKKPESLREKLIKRNESKNYRSVEHIYNDIVDLAGVRIATYFPEDRAEIGRLIEMEFNIHKIKRFPITEGMKYAQFNYRKRYAGYDAIHFRIKIKEEKLNEYMKRFAQAQIEIQIASTLMHAWAEVEHDLAYKPKIGSISEEEYEILDELNGLVLSGEIALKKLQKAFKARISEKEKRFNSHYELAAIIREELFNNNITDVHMGRVDILLRFLQKIDMDNPSKIKQYLNKCCIFLNNNTVVNDLVNRILYENPENYLKYLDSKLEIHMYNPYLLSEKTTYSSLEHKALKTFIIKLIELDNITKINFFKMNMTDVYDSLCLLFKNDEICNSIKYIYNVRNSVLFGNDIPEDEVLNSTIGILENIIYLLKLKIDISI